MVYRNLVYMVVLLMCVVAARADVTWQAETNGAFATARTTALVPDLGGAMAALELRYPRQTTSEPGQYAQWSTEVPATLPATVSFRWSDDFSGSSSGYHVLQLLLGDRVAWEGDVAGAQPRQSKVQVSLNEDDLQAGKLRLTFRLLEKRVVTNFPIRVCVTAVSLAADGKTLPLTGTEVIPIDAEPWPADLPLSALPATGKWSWQANTVQPWGATETMAVREAADWSIRLSRDYGMNAIILMPPPAHNAITAEADHITETEFRTALDLYRRAGMKTIVYSSIMHLGHDPRWQMGELEKTHPEWAMRDPQGNTVNTYGHPWLCPSTGALQYTLQYTAGLVQTYGFDGVMLDNNEFMSTNTGGVTCYCSACQEGFRRYLTERFGPAGLQKHFHLTPEQVQIPEVETDQLWSLWLAWRNRLWGEACETYRRELRRVRPDIVVLANTQYLHSNWLLAVDGQYEHLDAVLSESRGLDAVGMGAKMLLGRSLTVGRPLWNYIGTFNETDFTLLRPPDEVAGVCAASCAFGTNPWIVLYGFTGEANQPSLAMIRRYADFWHDNADLLGASGLRGEVAVLISMESRDLAQTQLPTGLLGGLLRQGQSVSTLRDAATLQIDRLTNARVLLATAASCLRESTARKLLAWARSGGTLVISPSTGWRDEAGRWRARSIFAELCGAEVATVGAHPYGEGTVLTVADDEVALAAVRQRVRPRVRAQGPAGVCWNVTADGRFVLSILGLDADLGSVTVRLPGNPRKVELRLPGQPPQPLEMTGGTGARRVTCDMPARLGLLVWTE